MLSFKTFINTLRKSFTLNGRATRTEFWNFHILSFLITILGTLILTLLGLGILIFLFLPFAIVWVISGISLAARRCHDLNKSAWYLLITLIPIVGTIFYYIYLGCFASVNENNVFEEKS